MNGQPVDGADFAVTMDVACSVRCEVLGDQIEFWFGDVGSGLHAYFDRRGYDRFVQVQSYMVERLRTAPDSTPISFVVGDDAHTPHGGISLDAYAVIDHDNPVRYQVHPSEAQIELGHGTGSLHLLVTEAGLAMLRALIDTALTDMRQPTV